MKRKSLNPYSMFGKIAVLSPNEISVSAFSTIHRFLEALPYVLYDKSKSVI